MNDHIAATPLKLLTWNREAENVRIEFREGTDRATMINFLHDLRAASKKLLYQQLYKIP